jgi:hypothetical protein
MVYRQRYQDEINESAAGILGGVVCANANVVHSHHVLTPVLTAITCAQV